MPHENPSDECILLTGAAGFIGSCLLKALNVRGIDRVIIVDDFSRADKLRNLQSKQYAQKIHRDHLFEWWDSATERITFAIHLGARTDTTEKDSAVFDRLNLHFSQKMWRRCGQLGIPLLYASSAATYGSGEHGFDDSHDLVPRLQPLNPYGQSKNEFDKWVLEQAAAGVDAPPSWWGMKFFNVYGPNEYHKGRMASVVFHAFRQISELGKLRLFKSHRPEYQHGEQRRDFIYVKDVVEVLLFFLEKRPAAGLYNVGTGQARSFLDLAKATFGAMGRQPVIEFIDIPEDIRQTYQYFTEANVSKLRSQGYTAPFRTLEEGIEDYTVNYLMQGQVAW